MRILIVGAGIAGLTAALALLRDGHEVAVCEQAAKLTELGAVGANTLARAVARGVFEAKALPGGPPSWQDCHGPARPARK